MNLNVLNENQRKAVEYTDGPLLVLAGAGSGKTRVLTYKIAYLMQEKKVYPSQILAITFTNKAAKEMKNRIYNLVGDEAHGLWMGTFHSIAVKILRRYAERIGYGKDFVIYDSLDQKSIIRQCIKELGVNKEQFSVKIVTNKISNAKNKMITPENYRHIFPNDFTIANIYERYEEKMFKSNGMDFDNIIFNVNRLLKENQDVADFYRQHFKYVLVDEYQDTNKAQYSMVNLLTKGQDNLFVVGDNDQSIYGWRGADIRNITEFEKDFKGAKVIKLEQNYRSTNNILEAANGVIQKNLYRKDKNLWSAKEKGELISFYPSYDEYDEADFVVRKVNSLISDGCSTKEMAILYRTNAQSRLFEERFRRYDIPYRVVGSIGFYARKEIKDMLSYMKVIQNPKDEVSITRVINEPKRGIGQKTIEKIAAMAMEESISFFEMMKIIVQNGTIGGRAGKGLAHFCEFVVRLNEAKENMALTDLLTGIYTGSGYEAMLSAENSLESQARMENIGELFNAVAEYQMNDDEFTLGGFLESISLMSDVDRMDDEEIGVTMMTLHSAKGLEFPVVFMVGMEEGLFPTSRAFDSADDLEEERRLCYVGMTRAEERLFLSCASQRTLYGQSKPALMSRFIGEIPEELIINLNSTQKIAKKSDASPDFLSMGMSPKQFKPKNEDKKKLASVTMGMRVKHKIFGIGTVVSVENKNATIAFEDRGIKKLHIDYAPLEEVE